MQRQYTDVWQLYKRHAGYEFDVAGLWQTSNVLPASIRNNGAVKSSNRCLHDEEPAAAESTLHSAGNHRISERFSMSELKANKCEPARE